MPASKQGKVSVACPHCGQSQPVPPTAISTVCKKCGGHFHVQEAMHPAPKKVERAPDRRRITCFDCKTELEVATTAESTMCKRCSSYIDLKDYQITSAVSKNFKTKGKFVVEPKGYVFNTEVVVSDAVIKGRFLGKLFAEHSLTIFPTAEFKGSFKTGCLIIPAETNFRWKELIKVGSAEIAGEMANDLQAEGTVILKSTARMFGNLEARKLVVEPGAVVVGQLRIGGAS